MAGIVAERLRCCFELRQHGAADAPETRIRRDVIQRDLAIVPDGTDRKHGIIFDRDEDSITGVLNPRLEIFRSFVGKPSGQNAGLL